MEAEDGWVMVVKLYSKIRSTTEFKPPLFGCSNDLDLIEKDQSLRSGESAAQEGAYVFLPGEGFRGAEGSVEGCQGDQGWHSLRPRLGLMTQIRRRCCRR
jgi:hypothetical protein